MAACFLPGRLQEAVAVRRVHGENITMSLLYYACRKRRPFNLFRRLFLCARSSSGDAEKISLFASAYAGQA
jgi:hypothetical protein